MRRLVLVAGLLALAAGLWLLLADEEHTTTPPDGENVSLPQGPDVDAALREVSDAPGLRGLGRPVAAPSAMDVLPKDAGSSVQGRVIDEHGDGVAGATVALISRVTLSGMFGATPMEFKSNEVLTARDGSFELIANEGTLVRAQDGAEWSRSVAVETGKSPGPITLRVIRRPAIAGIVFGVGGKPAAGTALQIAWTNAAKQRRTLNTKSAGDGTFAARVPPGVHHVDVLCGLLEGGKHPANAPMGSAMKGVTLPHTDLVFHLRPPAFIRGATLAADGTPLAHIHIVALAEFDSPLPAPRLQIHSDKSGNFIFGPLRPETAWRLVAVARGSTHTYTEQVVDAGEEDVTFHLTAPSVLAGRLTGGDCTGFSVQWSIAEGPEGARGGTSSVDANGTFRITGLPSGPVHLYARKIGAEHYGMLRGALPGPTVHEVALTEGLVVDGACKGYSGRVIFHQGPLQHECRAENGRFSMRGLPPGAWALRRVARSEGKGYAMEWETGEPTEVVAGDRHVTLR